MVDRFTERYNNLFSPLHPVIQGNINNMIAHFRQINLEVQELGGGFLTDNVMQIAVDDNIVFQAVLGTKDITFDLYDVRQI